MSIKNGKIIACEWCGKERYYSLSAIKRSKHKYCCTACQNRAEKSRGIDKTIKAHQSIRDNGQPSRKGKPAGWIGSDNELKVRKKISLAKLKNNWMTGKTGELHHNWRGGKYMGQSRFYRGNDWEDQRLKALERSNYQCEWCGMTDDESRKEYNQPLQVDHIIPYRIVENNELSNLQVLCCSCHGIKGKLEGEIYFEK